jgi:hypothetical protein
MQDQIFGSDFAIYENWSVYEKKHSFSLVFISPLNPILVHRVSNINKKRAFVVKIETDSRLRMFEITKN